MRAFSSWRLAAVLLALAVALPACDSGTDEPVVTDQIIGGVNFTRLFAPATAPEVAAVRADWAARQTMATGIQVSAPATLPDGAKLYVVSHLITTGPGAGGDARHYGFVRVPAGAANLPVIVVHHGGDSGVYAATPNADPNADVLAVASVYPTLASTTVQVFPSYRSEPLGTQPFNAVLGGPYRSGGSPSPWDYDVDDAMMLLSAVLGRDEFAAATNDARVGALGYSRGANTALLHNVRDARIRATTEYYGPTDFFSTPIQTLGIGVLGGSPLFLAFPGAPFILATVLAPLQGPNQTYNADANYAAARLEVVRRSSSLFTAQMRNVQVHHHTADPVVPYPVSVSFDAAATAARPTGAYEFNTYSDALPAGATFSQHNPRAMPASLGRTEQFLGQYVGAGARPATARLVAAN